VEQKTMKTTLAKVTGLALLAASFAFNGPIAYADTDETTSIQILTFDAVGNPGEIVAALDCDTGDGMGSPVETLVAADAATTVADAFDPAVLEATADATADAAEPAIQPVDTIIVTGNTAIDRGLATPLVALCASVRVYPLGHSSRVGLGGARIGDDLFALAIIELLRHLECLAGRPAETRTAQFLQRRQIMQLGRPLSPRLSSTRTASAPSKP
jgi:hypothetical protein